METMLRFLIGKTDADDVDQSNDDNLSEDVSEPAQKVVTFREDLVVFSFYSWKVLRSYGHPI